MRPAAASAQARRAHSTTAEPGQRRGANLAHTVEEAMERVAELKIKQLGGYLVNIKVNTANVITVFFDKMEGVQVEHCLAISKYVPSKRRPSKRHGQ